MAAAGAAEVPVLAYLAIGLLAMLAWLVSRGLHSVWVHTFGVVFNAIGGVKIPTSPFSSVHPFGFVEDASNSVANAFLAIARKSEHTMGYFFHGAAVIQGWAARELLGLARDTLAWATWLQHAHLPRWVKALVYAAVPPLLIIRLVKAAIAANLPHLGRVVVTRVEHTVVTHVTRIIHATAGAVAIPGWAIRLPGRVGHLEHDLASVRARLRSLEKYAGATGAVALFAAAIAKLGLRWIRCRNVTRAGKAICATDTSLLDSLLGDALLIVSAVSVVEFAKELLALEDEALTVASHIIREFPSPSHAA
jgi:hypothetical protein